MITLAAATVRLSERHVAADISFQLGAGDVWALVGANGSGKSALASVVAGQGELLSGVRSGLPARVGLVSLEAQRALIDRERERDDSDITDEVFAGTPVAELIAETCRDPVLRDELLASLAISDLQHRGFRKLSTGETRKLLLTRALCCEPGLLVLDEPFEGLDAAITPVLTALLERSAGQVPMVLVFNRIDEIPPWVTHLGYVEAGRITQQARRDDEAAWQSILQLFHLRHVAPTLPAAEPEAGAAELEPGEPLFRLRQGTVRYGDNTVFENLDWQVDPGVHWQVTGPNGSGKTCLLNLITGDNPQCYNNDIRVFGMQRGGGESIWEIKAHIGYVSSALQWDYRVSVSVRNAIISGFYDSIGLYANATDVQMAIADAWLALLGMSARGTARFSELSFGDQRLILIARAMVKHPTLLILDEPCIGLDDVNRQLVLALVTKICTDTATTVIYVNHHAEDRIPGIEHYLALG